MTISATMPISMNSGQAISKNMSVPGAGGQSNEESGQHQGVRERRDNVRKALERQLDGRSLFVRLFPLLLMFRQRLAEHRRADIEQPRLTQFLDARQLRQTIEPEMRE